MFTNKMKGTNKDMKKHPFFAKPNHRPPPLQFLLGIYVFSNNNKKSRNLDERHKGRRNRRDNKSRVNPFVFT